MPNPTVGILDDFNRADENPLSNGGKWAQVTGGPSALKLVSNACEAAGTGGSNCRMAWDAATFGGNVEIATKLLQLPSFDFANQSVVELFVKMSDKIDWSATGYVLKIEQTGGSTYDWKIYKTVGGSLTQLATATQTIAVNDEIFFEAKNDASGTLTGYQNGNQVLQATDTTYKDQTGYLWLGIMATTTPARWDDFKGGVTVGAAVGGGTFDGRFRFRPSCVTMYKQGGTTATQGHIIGAYPAWPDDARDFGMRDNMADNDSRIF